MEVLIYNSKERKLLFSNNNNNSNENNNENKLFESFDFNERKLNQSILKIVLNLNNKRELKYNQETKNIDNYEQFINIIHSKYEQYLRLQEELEEKKNELERLKNKLKVSPKTSEINWQDLVLQEERLRLSSEIAEQYQQTERDESLIDWIQFTATHIQPRILESNGLEVNPENLYKLRAAAQQTDVFWIKYNRARRGDLKVDDLIPSNVVLYNPSTSQHLPLTSISNSLTSFRPLVLLAGSIS